MRKISPSAVFLVGILLFFPFCLLPDTQAQIPSPSAAEDDTTTKGAPYVPSSNRVVLKLLELADVSNDDVVYDLGSGDGRIVIAAARDFGARGVGVEIDSQLVQKARAKAREAGVADRVEFRQGDLFDTDLSDATVVTLYLWPDMNNRLRPKLQRELDPGDRVVSHSFDIDDWPADTTVYFKSTSSMADEKTLFRWTIPNSTEAQ
jgi:SAM-dependent methyltransferase